MKSNYTSGFYILVCGVCKSREEMKAILWSLRTFCSRFIFSLWFWQNLVFSIVISFGFESCFEESWLGILSSQVHQYLKSK